MPKERWRASHESGAEVWNVGKQGVAVSVVVLGAGGPEERSAEEEIGQWKIRR